MASNWQIEASGLMSWSERTRDVDFEGKTYNINFVNLSPENYEESLLRVIDDHTALITVDDPNNLK